MNSIKPVRLSEVVTEALPGFACGAEDPDGVLQIRMNNILRDGNLDLTKKRRVPSNIKAISRTLLRPGDVLFNATNSPDLVGKTALIKEVNEPTVFSNHFFRLRTDNQHLSPAYLARWLSWQFGRGVFKGMVRQWVNQATVGRQELLSLKIPLLPLENQQRITTVLDHVDTLLAKRRQSVVLLDDLTRSIFVEMFGDPGAGKSRWALRTAADVADQITDGEHITPKREEDGIKLLSARNVRDGYIDFERVDHIAQDEYERIRKRCNPSRGDVLISCSGTIGRVAVVETDEPLALVRSAALVKPNRSMVTSTYLANYLRTPALKIEMLRRAKSSSQANLFQGSIKALPVLVPPLDLQNDFSKRIAEVAIQKSVHQAHLAALDSLFASLQYRAFRGGLWGLRCLAAATG